MYGVNPTDVEAVNSYIKGEEMQQLNLEDPNYYIQSSSGVVGPRGGSSIEAMATAGLNISQELANAVLSDNENMTREGAPPNLSNQVQSQLKQKNGEHYVRMKSRVTNKNTN